MGNESSTAQMEKTMFNMKMTAKTLARESKRCEAKSKEEEKKCLAAMEKGNDEIAKVYAANSIREKNQSVNFLRLSSRIDAVAARVETAIRMNTLTKNIVSVTHGMDAILGGMDIEKIANVMDKFEKQFETLDVRSSNMERSIASSTATSVPEEEVDDLMSRVKAANDIKTKGGLVDAGSGALGTGVAAAAPGRVAEAAAVAPAPGPGGKPDDRGGAPGAGGGAAGGAGGPSGGGAMGGAGGGGGGDSVGDLASRLAALRR